MGYSSTEHDLLSTENVFEDADVVTEVPSTLISQYSNAERIKKLSIFLHKHLDDEDTFQVIFKEVFDVETAQGVFLDYWGAIVGVNRSIIDDEKTITLDDNIFRELIMFRAAMNISQATIVRINELLTDLFNIPIAIVDNGDMTMRIFLDEAIEGDVLALIKFYGYTLKPAGVGYDIVMMYEGTLGFFGQSLRNFNFGVFNPDDPNAVGVSDGAA